MEIRTDHSRLVDIVARKGATFILDIDVTEDGLDFNFTNHIVEMELFTSTADKVPNLTFNPILSAGNIHLEKTAAIMESFRAGKYVYRLWVTDNTAQVKELWLNGFFFITDSLQDDPELTMQLPVTINTGNNIITLDIVSGGGGGDIDGGAASTIYLASQSINGGSA